MSAADRDIALEDVLEGDADPEAYNEAVEADLEARIEERIERMDEAEQAAVEALVDDAKSETTTVPFSSGLEIEVYERLTSEAEDHVQAVADLYERDETPSEAVLVGAICEALASMVVTEPYGDADVWEAAYHSEDGGGTQWLHEMFDRIVEPAVERAEARKNEQLRSDDTRSPTAGN